MTIAARDGGITRKGYMEHKTSIVKEDMGLIAAGVALYHLVGWLLCAMDCRLIFCV